METGRSHDTDRRREDWKVLALHLLAPAAILAAALILPSYMITSTREFRGSGPGPAAWPGFMLTLIAAGSAIWLVQEVLAWRRGRDSLPAQGADPGEEVEHYSHSKAVAGLVLILAYGWLLPVIGFTLATAAFMLAWCLLGGIRNAFVLILVPVIGTVALLWLFMGLALMPLSRGRGVFDQISIAVLQLLGIY